MCRGRYKSHSIISSSYVSFALNVANLFNNQPHLTLNRIYKNHQHIHIMLILNSKSPIYLQMQKTQCLHHIQLLVGGGIHYTTSTAQ